MRWFCAAVVALWSVAASATSTITHVNGDNGTTLPFQRHMTRLGPAQSGTGTLVAAIQNNGDAGLGLEMYESTNEGGSWADMGGIQSNYAVRSVADLLSDTDGNGFSLVYGTEPVSSAWSENAAFTVVFLHYTLGSGGAINQDLGPVTLFTPNSSQGYFRPALTRDSTGTLHVTASLMSSGSFSWWERMSIDDGNEWTSAVEIESFGSSFGGGRTVAFGNNVMAVYDAYDANTTGRYRIKGAGACTSWGSEVSFVSDGLYHAGAFSITATPDGHVHLGNSDKDYQELWYREFDGENWSSARQIESYGIWSNQPALSQYGNNIVYAWNHADSTTTNRIFVQTLSGGTWSGTTVLDSTAIWDGYTNSLEVIPSGGSAQIIWSAGPEDASSPMAVQDTQFTP